MYRDLQQLVDHRLLVPHVGHIRHIDPVKLRAVLQHNVFHLRNQHTLLQLTLQIHKEPISDKNSNLAEANTQKNKM